METRYPSRNLAENLLKLKKTFESKSCHRWPKVVRGYKTDLFRAARKLAEKEMFFLEPGNGSKQFRSAEIAAKSLSDLYMTGPVISHPNN